MGRSPCCEKVGLRKGTWTSEEDQKLVSYIHQHGHGSWRSLPAKAGLQRCGKSCRLRWSNYLRPDIKRGKFTSQEEQTIIQLHALLGNRWSAIATHLPKRTDNEIKNYWNTHLKKRLSKMGIDPSTHKPKMNPLDCSGQYKDSANLSHMAQWESARLEAESRLARESKLVNNIMSFSVSPIQSIPPCLDVLKAWQLGSGAWKNINNGFFNPGGTLESPTSTLNFSDNILTGSTTSCTAANLADKNNVMPFSAGMITEGCANGPIVTINDDIIDNYAAYFEESLIRAPIFSEEFKNVVDSENVPFGDNTGDLEDNRRYWNNIFNVEFPTSDKSNLTNFE